MAVISYKFGFDWQSVEKMTLGKLKFWYDKVLEISKAERGES